MALKDDELSAKYTFSENDIPSKPSELNHALHVMQRAAMTHVNPTTALADSPRLGISNNFE